MGQAVDMKPRLLWVGKDAAPPNVRCALGEGRALVNYSPDEPLGPQFQQCSLALIYPNGSSHDTRALGNLLHELDNSPAVAVFLLPPQARSAWEMLARHKGQFVCVSQDVPPAELAAKIEAMTELQPALSNLRSELATATGGQPLVSQRELNEEMRLAARLQRDFLPRRLPEIGPARFSVLYRPLSWVSGDIYDITRLDETHIGFYVADAVGHGMPAALLTMFIKKALQTKRIVGNTYQIVPPEVSLSELNADICDQALSSCQFCTALYAIFDTASMTLTYARAGHPEAVLLHADGSAEKIEGPGSLLGIFPQEQYESRQVTLQGGDRLVLYTDGAEPAFRAMAGDSAADIDVALGKIAAATSDDLVLSLTAHLEQVPASCQDDVTVVVMDILADQVPHLVRL